MKMTKNELQKQAQLANEHLQKYIDALNITQ